MSAALSMGFLWVIVLFFMFNLITLWIGPFASDFLTSKVKYISGFYFLLILSMVTNLIFILLLAVLNLIKGLFVGR